MDGKPLPPAFQRLAGFCEQADIHDEFSTVREALQFSALLRQPANISREEKNAYCETVLELLELQDYAEARIGSGLSIEIMKRVTIGVELAAKPALLLFLDEPTRHVRPLGLVTSSSLTFRFSSTVVSTGRAPGTWSGSSAA
jgi:ABC-type multidrug transport system ATPase subunit